MESFLSELGSKKVISREDIILLKQYIYKKHNNRSNIEKSKILTDAIHKILDKSIEGISSTYIQNIKSQLLKEVVSGENKTVYMADVFNVCMDTKDDSEDFFESLKNWVNRNVEHKISETEIEECAITYRSNVNEEVYVFDEEENIKDNTEENKTDFGQKAAKETGNFEQVVADEMAITVAETLPINDKQSTVYDFTSRYLNKFQHISLKNKRRLTVVIVANIVVVISIFILFSVFHKPHSADLVSKSQNRIDSKSKTATKNSKEYKLSLLSNLPKNFRYKETDIKKLRNFLNKRKSLLAKEPYFSTIINVSKEYNLNPHILFAVTGQEQGFVPKNKKHAKRIVNNPFNVYVSWKKYNTNLKDATKIACVTIINMCKNRPNESEAFKWINKNYAEDSNWHKGVRSIFNMLEKYCSK